MRSVYATVLIGSAIGILQLACSDPNAPDQRETGTVLVTLAARGNGVDADGFSLAVGDTVQRLRAGDTLRVTGLAPGNYTLRVGGVASHCAATPDSASVQVQNESTTTVQLSAECYGKLLYTEWRPGDNQLFYLDEYGVRRKLTNQMDGGQWIPRWSPDGTRVVFQHLPAPISSAYSDLFIADLQGNVRPLAARPNDYEAQHAWSPDGQWVAYVLMAGTGTFSSTDLRLVRVDGSDDHSILNDGGIALAPTWSPDGVYIAFACWRDVQSICYIKPNGELLGRAPVTLTVPQRLNWSPAGSHIAFEDFSGGRQSIRILDVQTTELFNAVSAPTSFSYPYWSPDGRRLAVNVLRNDTVYAYVVNPDGSDPRMIAAGTRWLGDWTTDGSRIAFGLEENALHIGGVDTSRLLFRSNVPLVGVWWRPGRAASTAGRVPHTLRLSLLPLGPISPRTIENRVHAHGMISSHFKPGVLGK